MECAVHASNSHGWSFFGKVGGGKIELADGFQVKIGRFNVDKP